MKRKKGFTLIELLAVIVILAIIALITVPTVIKIINNAKKGAAEDSTYGAVEAAKLYWASHATFDNESESEGVTFTCGNDGCKYNDDILDISGDKPTSGTITISSGNVTASNLVFGNFICNLSNDRVTCNSDVITEPESFATDSWDTISKAVKKGNTSKYNVGDSKCIVLDGFTTTNENGCNPGEFKVRIANMSECNNGELSDTACGFVIEFEDVIEAGPINSNGTSQGGFKDSNLRTYINNDIYNSLPNDLKELIISTKVVSGHGSLDNSNFVTNDKLYIFSEKEIYGTSAENAYGTASDATRQLDYYRGIGAKNYTKAIKYGDGEAWDWWTRTPTKDASDAWFGVYHTGQWYGYYWPDNNLGISPAFKIG